ncbi:hypothetical protein NX059_003771 [Plenodomus lindquistii]|nr:hypothetical protein NX059_003771 [Plenodomus lindquistii]
MANADNSPDRFATKTPLGSALFQLSLSHTNKAEIFSEALASLENSQQQTSTILQNLQRWNPTTASQFALRSPATILSTPFRLIYPNSDLWSFDETGLYARQFMAISYCWRSPDFVSEDYEPHDVWPIKKSFVDAILSEKPHPRCGIWMDQLCIDQTSSEDKRIAVAAMDIIYRSCLRLVVLLEDVVLNEEEIALVNKYDFFTRPFDRTWHFESHELPIFASFYEKVDNARWWKRAWCFHEFSVHQPWSEKRQTEWVRNATFILGGPNDTTIKMKWVNMQLLMGSAMDALPDSPGWANAHALFSGIIKPEDEEKGWRSSIMARHNGVSEMGATVLQDKLSIVLNLCGLWLAYVGPLLRDYEEMFYLSSVLALAAGETNPLTLMREQSLRVRGQGTWLSKHSAEHDTTIPAFKVGTLEGVHSVNEREIELDLLFLDANWHSVKEKDLKPTYDIFPDMITTTAPQTHVKEAKDRVMSIYSSTDPELDIPRRRFLAGCILNGPVFTGRLWEQLKRDVVAANYNNVTFKDFSPNPSFRDAAKTLIAKLVPVSTLLCIGQAQPSDDTLDDAALFLTWLTDPRSAYYIGLRTFRVPVTTYWDSVFITSLTCNEQFSGGPEREIRIAVPTDLLGTSCIPLRVWILRPAGGEAAREKWRVVGKGLLLGEPDLLQEARETEGVAGAKVFLTKRVIVGGM